MLSKRENRFGQRRRRLWCCFALAAICVLLGALFRPPARPSIAAGLGDPLVWQSAGQLPQWASHALARFVDDSRSQIVVALADLNRDRSPEILIAPAPSRHDVFVSESKLRLLQSDAGSWRLSAAALSCRPRQLGGFVTNGYWDLPCRAGARSVALRWSGSRYQAGSPPAIP